MNWQKAYSPIPRAHRGKWCSKIPCGIANPRRRIIMKISSKQILLGSALIILPGTSLVLGGYLLYKGIKKARTKKSQTMREFIDELKAETEKDFKEWNDSSHTTPKQED